MAPAPPGPKGLSEVRLRAKVPWDKLSDIIRGVIQPLRSDGAEVEIELSLHARSEAARIQPATLEHKVMETLRQVGAEILEQERK